jgi:AraC-like DNA-binding protein
VGERVCVGIFRAHPDDGAFGTAGLPSLPTFVFPRSAVWIEHEGRRPFVADPNVITLYNPGAQYRRRALRPHGDRCEWFQVTPELLEPLVSRLFPGGLDLEAPFRWARLRGSPGLYLRQRLVTRYVIESENPDPKRVERAVVSLLEEVLAMASRAREGSVRDSFPAQRRRRDLVERARAQLDLHYQQGMPLAALASRLETSVHHLCRLFKRGTGLTIHQYQNRLRMAEALERIRGGERLIDAAFDLGFSSHSHFTESFRKTFGVPPSGYGRLSVEAIGQLG